MKNKDDKALAVRLKFQHPKKTQDAILLASVFVLFILLPPFLNWWAIPGRPWFLPYVIWGGVILLIYLVHLSPFED